MPESRAQILFCVGSRILFLQDVMVAGGMESMSNVPFYLLRGELPYGGGQIIVSESIGVAVSYTEVNIG